MQFRTREARFADSSSYRQSDVSLTLSSADDSAWVSGSTQGGTDSQAYILQAGYQNVGDRSTARDGRLDQSDYTARSFRGQWRYLFDPSRDFSFDLQYLRQPSTPRLDQLIPGFGQDEPDAVEFFFEPNQRLFAHARFHQSGLGFVDDMELHLSFQQIDDDRRSLDTGSTSRRLEENSSALLTLSGQFSSFWDDYDLVYGFEVTEDRVDSSRLSEDIITGLRERATARFPDGSEQRSKAAFAEFSINRWINHDLQLGVRYTDIDIDLAESDRGVGASLNLDDLTANIGYRYQINPEMALIANIAEGFRSPNIFDLSTLGPRPGNRFNIANPDLEPEKLISYDIGLKWQSRRFEGELVLFQADYDDRIASVPTGEFTDTGREVVQSENINSQQNQGVELSWRYYAESGIDYEGAINWIRGEERDENGQSQPGDRIPPMNARFAVRWPFTDDTTLRAWTDIARRQDRLSDRDIRDSRINPAGTPGYAIVNLQARHQINPVWDLNFSLRNLFDKAYRQHGSGIDAPGRHATLSISGQF